MVHVCDVNNFYSPTGGGVKTYHNHKMAYFKAHPELEYTLFQPDDHESIEHLAPNVRIVHFPGVAVDANYRYMLDVPRMGRLLKRFNPDIVEIGSPYLLPWIIHMANRGLNAALVGFWHADYPRTYVQRPLGDIHPALGHMGHEAAWWYARKTFERFHATFASADCVIERLWQRGIPRIFQTPLGVDIERFSPTHRDPELRRSVGADDDRPVFFFPHRLLEEKGLSALLSAWPKIYDAHQPILVFAGVGPGKPKLDAFMARQKDIHYLGYVKDPKLMAAWYASSDAVFALSAFETFGLSAAEAMASGCALVAADAGAVEEFVTRADCGVLVPYNDADALATQTISLLDSGHLGQAGRNAHTFANTHFNWDAAFDRMVAHYKEIADASSPQDLPPAPRRWQTGS